jgi:ABC-type multidrug transport system ATPase subunit
MRTCPHCRTANAPEHKFCQQCGRSLDGDDSSPVATVRWSGQIPLSRGLRRSVPVDQLFGAKKKLVIGRATECDVCLPHPTISRYHARLSRTEQGLLLEDLHSVNGIQVNGRRLHEPARVGDNERVGIGPYLFRLSAGVIDLLDNSQNLRLEARSLEKVILQPDGQRSTLLDDVNLVVEPGEFLCLLGPSGSGKSTLMDCLNGRRPATAGRVLANGEDFYLNFDNFRQSLGYVPQRDIVHTQLTVERALYYTARLRLPTDTSPSELASRLEEVLNLMELQPHRGTLIGNLSGGQIKRVSLGAELLARPCLLYIDEATSGLDAGTEARMMRLFRRLTDEGKSVVCITHNVDNVDLCHLILMLARGKLVYYGPPAEARTYFGVSRVSEIYDQLGMRDPDAWQKQFAESSLHHEFVQKRLEARPDETPVPKLPVVGAVSLNARGGPVPATEKPQSARRLSFPIWHQLWVLTQRYLEMIWRDKQGLSLVVLQAPVVALFILLGFVGKPYQDKVLTPRKLESSERAALRAFNERVGSSFEKSKGEIAKLDPAGNVARMVETLKELPETQGPVVPVGLIVNPRYTYMLLFLMVLIVLWFGCNNAAKEIVKEEAIYGRERAVNLGIFPYLASKFLVLSLITALQALMLMVLIHGTLYLFHVWLGHPIPPAQYRLDDAAEFGVLGLLSMTGVALGLALSACVATPDRATSLLPYVLIPQIILGGGILMIREGPLWWLAILLSPAYWAYRVVRAGETSILPPDFPGHMDYNDSVWIGCVALLIQTAVLLLLTAWFLRQKDVRKA